MDRELELLRKIEALVVERDKLRAALGQIVARLDKPSSIMQSVDGVEWLHETRAIAHRALNGE